MEPNETPVEETVPPQPAETQEVETPVETEQPTGTTETQEQPAPPPVETPSETEKRSWKLKVDGDEVEVSDEAELLELAQKGFHFNKRMQSLSEVDKAVEQERQLGRQLLGNEQMLKALAAQSLGIDPAMMLSEPQEPDPQLQEYNPQLYWQLKTQADLHRRQKQAAEQHFVQLRNFAGAQIANAAFEKARIQHNLSDAEFQQMRQFVSTRLAPTNGMYTDEDMALAVNALFGPQRAQQAKLTQTKKIQQVVKNAATATPKNPPSRPTEVAPEVKAAQEFKEYVKSLSGG